MIIVNAGMGNKHSTHWKHTTFEYGIVHAGLLAFNGKYGTGCLYLNN